MRIDPSIVGTTKGYILLAINIVILIICIVYLKKSNNF